MAFAHRTSPSLPKAALRGLIPLATLAALSVAGAAAVFVQYLTPAQEQLAGAERAYQHAKQTQAGLQATRAQQVRARTAQRQLEIVRQALPVHEEFTPLAMALSELAKNEHVAIPGMGYDVMKAEGTQPLKATIAFRASGEYAAVYRFIHRLETADPYVVIESLDVAGKRQQDFSPGLVVVNIKVATYLRQGPGPEKSS